MEKTYILYAQLKRTIWWEKVTNINLLLLFSALFKPVFRRRIIMCMSFLGSKGLIRYEAKPLFNAFINKCCWTQPPAIAMMMRDSQENHYNVLCYTSLFYGHFDFAVHIELWFEKQKNDKRRRKQKCAVDTKWWHLFEPSFMQVFYFHLIYFLRKNS